jgi:phage gp45-like
MHRATPYNSSFRAYTSGGARATVSSVDDGKLMQEIGASFMKGEKRSGIETPHTYGFATVPFDPDKDKEGNETAGPECFMQFMGGNRSFPVSGPVDDRRHRLKGLEKGDVALFRGKDDGQQFHMNGIGSFLSTFPGKKLRMQIVKKAQAAARGGGAATFAEGGAGGAQQADGVQAAEEKGQKAVYKNDSDQYFEVDEAKTESVNKKHTIMMDDKATAVELIEVGGQKRVYLGGRPELGHQFSRVMTESGLPSINVFARIG